MRVLVTGSDGYLGCIAAPVLRAAGHDVLGVDTGFYSAAALFEPEGRPPTLDKDIRRLDESDLDGVDAVVHMAELSNDPIGQLAPDVTYEINHRGSVRLAEVARAAGVERFVYMSSCSVYGAGGGTVTEESPVDPQTAYAECKVLVERDVGAMAGDEFSPVFLRNATAYGASPRMRFDIVLNNLAGLAWTTGEIKMVSDGTPWRPLVHARDIASAIRCVLAAPRDAIHNAVLNVGDSRENYRVREIAEIVADVFPDCSLSFGAPSGDNRSYRVSFDRIAATLPGFGCEWTARDGAIELRELFEGVGLTGEAFESPAYTRLLRLEQLLRGGELDESFFWRR